MKKKLLGFIAFFIIVSFIFTTVYITQIHNIFSKKITLPTNEITSGEVSDSRIGGKLSHELSSDEIKEFIYFFNSCNIIEEECKKISGEHTAISDSTDITLQMNNGTTIYYMAFWDGEISVTDEYSSKYYSLYNTKLYDYILNMGECLYSKVH